MVRFMVVAFISGVLLNPLGKYSLQNVSGIILFHENSCYRTLALLEYTKNLSAMAQSFLV